MDAMSQNNGTAIGGVSFSAGYSGNAFNIGDPIGNPGHVLVPASSTLNVGLGSGFTIGAWINPTTTTPIGRPIVEWAVPGGYGVHLFTWNSGAVYGNIINAGGGNNVLQSAAGVLTVNQYQHVALRYDKASGFGSLFVNGVNVAELNFGSFTAKTDTDMRIGFRPDTSPFGPLPFLGQIDEVTLYNRALSNNEILTLAAVPEPAIGALLCVGFALIFAKRRT